MNRYMVFTAEKLGTVRHKVNPKEAQERDIQLFIEHFLSDDYVRHGEIGGGTYLADLAESQDMLKAVLVEKSTVLVAYLSCLGSNSTEISHIIDQLNGDVMVAELPNATAEELKIYAKLEDSKKKFMGIRSKAGIEQAKADGKNIGGLRRKTKERNEQKTQEANDKANELKEHLIYCKREGFTLSKTAEHLNDKGLRTAQDKEFKPMTVKRYIDRLTS